MPQLVCRPTGKGKNSRVLLDNLGDVAAALQRPPACEHASDVNATWFLGTSLRDCLWASDITQYITFAAGVGKSNKEEGAGGVHSLRVDPSRIEGLLQVISPRSDELSVEK